MHDERLGQVLVRFPGKRVLVVGDVMLDEYVWGSVRRVSPEAPVPVVELSKRTCAPGGAANAAANVAALGAEALLVGVVGGDESGRRLVGALRERGVETAGLVADADRPTTAKTRVVAHHQQVVRVDHEDRSPLPAGLEAQLVCLIEERLPSADACLLSDYAKGLVSPALAQGLIRAGAALGKPVVVDPKGVDAAKYRGAALVKPNLHEASVLLRRDLATEEDVREAGGLLLDHLGARAVLLTRGPEGMSLFEPGSAPVHIPARAREVYDVTGAGDTVAAALAVALAAGAGAEGAARLAARAAAVAVGRLGTAAVTLEELLASDP